MYRDSLSRCKRVELLDLKNGYRRSQCVCTEIARDARGALTCSMED